MFCKEAKESTQSECALISFSFNKQIKSWNYRCFFSLNLFREKKCIQLTSVCKTQVSNWHPW